VVVVVVVVVESAHEISVFMLTGCIGWVLFYPIQPFSS
jgi:hypothetical protein